MSPVRRPAPLTLAAVLNLEHAHGQGILRGIASAVKAHPHVLLLRFSHTRLQEPGWLDALGADGLIVKVSAPAEAVMLGRINRPVIDIGAECARHNLVRVTTDNLAVGEMAAGYFLRRGFRQFGYVGITGHGASVLRGEGFARRISEGHLRCAVFEDAFDRSGREHRGAVSRRLRRWLESLPIPAGLFCTDDLVATEVVKLCGAIGRPAPAATSILGCNNDLTEISASNVELSSIDLNGEQIGQEAARLLLGWLDHPRQKPATTLLRPLKLVTRQSTELFAVDDEAVLQALEFIGERLAGSYAVEDVARAAGISRRSLEMRFRRLLGTSVYTEVQRARFERAINLMGEPELRLADVARQAGFSSPAKRSAAFQGEHRMTPTRFRALHFGRARVLELQKLM